MYNNNNLKQEEESFQILPNTNAHVMARFSFHFHSNLRQKRPVLSALAAYLGVSHTTPLRTPSRRLAVSVKYSSIFSYPAYTFCGLPTAVTRSFIIWHHTAICSHLYGFATQNNEPLLSSTGSIAVRFSHRLTTHRFYQTLGHLADILLTVCCCATTK